MVEVIVTDEEVQKLHTRLDKEAKEGGYNLGIDKELIADLIRGLLINEKRYGYWACPCRLALGIKAEDLDIICPCDYRDPDLEDFGMCYCGLYVSEDVVRGKKEMGSIPDRRPPLEKRKEAKPTTASNITQLAFPVWRCKVCGYLCAREGPPGVCPICKAKKDRFERFI